MQSLAISIAVLFCALASASARVSRKDEFLPHSVNFSVPNWVHRSKLRGGALLWKEESEHGKAYAQDYEDIIATNRYFHDRHNGVFLELGAADGRFCSNTKLLEDSRYATPLLACGKIMTRAPTPVTEGSRAVCQYRVTVQLAIAYGYHRKRQRQEVLPGCMRLLRVF